MAKKKVSAKAPKKAAKAKPTAKAKKASPVKAKAKPAAKKVKAATPKKAAPKAAPKKEIAKKVVVAKKPVPPTPLKKTAKGPVATKEAPKAPPATSAAAKVAAAAQLNFFQMPNQRPMAHKPAKPSSQSEDKTRYSEDELKEFQSLIIKKLDKAKEEYKILKETLNRNNDEGTDATSGGNTKVLEDGAETAEKENLSQLAARQQKYIMNLENALVRIKNGTYGICSVTGKLISKERLIAVPHTTQSIEAKLMQQD
jgi:RNA polymerase-binding transcription factor DksA